MSVSAFIFFPTLWRERNTSPLPYLAVNPEAVLYCGCRSRRETDWGCRNDVPVVIFWQSLDYRNFLQTGHYPGFLYLIVIYLWLFLELADYCCDCATDSYIAVADLGEGPRLPPPPPYFGQKRRNDWREKGQRARKSKSRCKLLHI